MIGNIIGNFEIIDFIEEGGMGKVYLARQLTIDREVAIKIYFTHPAFFYEINDLKVANYVTNHSYQKFLFV